MTETQTWKALKELLESLESDLLQEERTIEISHEFYFSSAFFDGTGDQIEDIGSHENPHPQTWHMLLELLYSVPEYILEQKRVILINGEAYHAVAKNSKTHIKDKGCRPT